MALEAGTYRFGPANATLSVETGKGGVGAKAGHDLVLRVTAWEATLVVADDASATAVTLTADARSLRVQSASGGIKPLGDGEKATIEKTIDDRVLKAKDIAFRSTSAQGDGERLRVEGELTLVGRTQPVAFELASGADGALTGSAVVKQTRWGMKPYSALLGALKVLDEVRVVLEAPHGGEAAAAPTPRT